MRVLVVWCPDWSVVAALREAERPATEPAAVLAANVVEVCNGPAREDGVRRGMRRRDAQARCPELVLLGANPDRDARCFEPVLETVEALRPGVAPATGSADGARARALLRGRGQRRRGHGRDPGRRRRVGLPARRRRRSVHRRAGRAAREGAGVRAGPRGRLRGLPPRAAGRGARGRRRRGTRDGQPAARARAAHPRRPRGPPGRRGAAPLRPLRRAGVAQDRGRRRRSSTRAPRRRT